MTVRPEVSVAEVTGRRDWDAAVVLGSGMSTLATTLIDDEPIPYSEIPGMPVSTVPGHEGALYASDLEETGTLLFAGRVHLYEGRTPEEVTFPVRAAIGAGVETIVLTNAAGAVNEKLEVGAPCLISDHLNLTGQNPLTGPNDDTIGPRFLDLSEVYDQELRERARTIDPDLPEGVYAGLPGPTYETPAEVRMLRKLGADLVGMSTVHEAIAARYLGARVLGISLVSNPAAGLGAEPLSHHDVTAAAQRGAARLTSLLRALLGSL